MSKTLKVTVSDFKYREILEHVKVKELDSVASFIRKCINNEMKRRPITK